MNIEIQTTPDANIVNFFPEQPLLRSGSAEFIDRKSLRKSPLAEQIFDLGGIASLFITADMISVTKTDDADWAELEPLIMAEIMDYLALGDQAQVAAEDGSDNIVEQINALLNARIRPAVKRDGGDIKFVDFQDGIVTVEMQGSCKGCPYAMRTLKDGVEKILKTYIPQINEVRNASADDA
ncbi:MAG: NifU family protein [Alphaproteobacteria bacterium]|nr:NifU family protein [Alphaproteobacteria bacterium]MBQ9234904.1 NifU family protein [Alphaproteobacteria bacterium]